MHRSDQNLKFLTAAITTSLAATRLPQHDLAPIVSNITQQLQKIREQEVGCCIVVVGWKTSILAMPNIWE